MKNTIEKKLEELNQEESGFFTLQFDNDSGEAIIKKSKYEHERTLLGNMKLLENKVISNSENPFPMFAELDAKFHEIEKILSNDIFQKNKKMSLGMAHRYFKKKINIAFPADTSFTLWAGKQKNESYFLGLSTSEEEGEHGYFGFIFFGKLLK